MACATHVATQVVVVAPPSSATIVALTSGVAAATQSDILLLATRAACASPVDVDTHAELVAAATEILTRDNVCRSIDSHAILQRSAIRVLEHEKPHTENYHATARALEYLTALANTMPLDALLANKAMLPRVVATAIGKCPPQTRALAWTTALAISRRLVESPHNFQARIASNRLLPLLEHTHSLLEFATTQPRRVFAQHAHWLRKELLSALQLLCNLAAGDVYFASRLHQLHMPSALLAFGKADIVGQLLGEDAHAADMATRMQGAALRLQKHLMEDAS